jgi:hypothetical protein
LHGRRRAILAVSVDLAVRHADGDVTRAAGACRGSEQAKTEEGGKGQQETLHGKPLVCSSDAALFPLRERRRRGNLRLFSSNALAAAAGRKELEPTAADAGAPGTCGSIPD